MSKSAEELLEQEADELWKQHFGQDEGEGSDAGQEAKQETATEQPVADQQPAQPPQAADSADELDGLTLQNAEERVKNAQARMHAATREASDMRREIETLRVENRRLLIDADSLRQQLEQAQATPRQNADSGPIDDDDLKSALEEWPEIITPMMKRNRALEARLKQIESQVSEASRSAQEKIVHDAHNQQILASHPDAFDIARTDDFQGWVSRQTPMIQTAVNQGTADDVVWVLDQYKQAVGTNTRLNRAREAATPQVSRTNRQPKNGPKFSRAQIAAMSDEEFARHEADIDRALEAGLIV